MLYKEVERVLESLSSLIKKAGDYGRVKCKYCTGLHLTHLLV